MEKKIPVLRNKFSQDQSGINLVLFYPNLTCNKNEFNKGTEKNPIITWVILPLHKRTLVNVNKTINFHDLEHFDHRDENQISRAGEKISPTTSLFFCKVIA